jgi:replication factor A1
VGEEESVQKIAEATGKTGQEIERLIEEKKQKFSGILSGKGAAFMVAKDLGVEIGGDSLKRLTVSQLKDGMQNVDLLVRVMQVFAQKSFEKNGKKGKLCSMIVADSTGETRLTVWHEDVKKIQEAGIRRGTALLLHNCYVREFNSNPQLNLSYKGSFEVNPKEAAFSDLPKAKSEQVKISGLKKEMNDVGLVARVIRLFPVNVFDKGGRKGQVMNFVLGDETGTMRATAWNDVVETAKSLKEDGLVSIEGAYTKQGLKGLELHLGWQARISKKEEDEGIPKAAELLKQGAESKKIVEIKPGDKNVLVRGQIVSVNQGGLFYSICPECGGKVQRLEEGILCDNCGEVKEPGIRQVISFRIDDGSAQIDVAAYGKEAQKVTGLDNDELKKRSEERGREALVEELQSMAGKKVTAIGRAKENTYSGQLEISAKSIEVQD